MFLKYMFKVINDLFDPLPLLKEGKTLFFTLSGKLHILRDLMGLQRALSLIRWSLTMGV